MKTESIDELLSIMHSEGLTVLHYDDGETKISLERPAEVVLEERGLSVVSDQGAASEQNAAHYAASSKVKQSIQTGVGKLKNHLSYIEGLSQGADDGLASEAEAESGTESGTFSAQATSGASVASPLDTVVFVRSPMVGTFYLAPSPDEEPFVKVGQNVLPGQTLGIVEALRMMNEIQSPGSGIIMEVLAENGSQVEFDQPLFRLVAE